MFDEFTTVSARMSKDLAQKIENYCKNNDVNKSELIRELTTKKLAKDLSILDDEYIDEKIQKLKDEAERQARDGVKDFKSPERFDEEIKDVDEEIKDVDEEIKDVNEDWKEIEDDILKGKATSEELTAIEERRDRLTAKLENLRSRKSNLREIKKKSAELEQDLNELIEQKQAELIYENLVLPLAEKSEQLLGQWELSLNKLEDVFNSVRGHSDSIPLRIKDSNLRHRLYRSQNILRVKKGHVQDFGVDWKEIDGSQLFGFTSVDARQPFEQEDGKKNVHSILPGTIF